MKFIPALTTTNGSNWKEKFREIQELKIEEIALFLTGLTKEHRKTLYEMIKKSCIKTIPFVHLRSDMDVEELEFLAKEYDTQIFNTHSEREFPIDNEWLVKYKELICIENTDKSPLDAKEIKKYGGICLDFAHLENLRLLEKDKYKEEVEVLSQFPIKCNHISAIKKEFSFVDARKRKLQYDSHHMDDLSELDYLKNYPVGYFSDFCALELDNKIKEQLEAINHINEFMGVRSKFINKMLEH
ncbi:MAG TPA: hypothetical protein PLD14_03325 [Candidatus Pacearchaeota archaeon]|nr:hypothetical protein [Candidatus Pacearchaeota archaeon]HPR80229.1 hypothetical protein [Candidatus Pacearchaeota archaeon]